MKKLLVAAMMVFGLAANAQETTSSQTAQGKFVIEANTGSATTGSTAFSFSSQDGYTAWSIGAEGGYFVIDDLAVKAGLGFASNDNPFESDQFTYKIGAEYYILGNIPVGVDFTGTSVTGGSVNWIGLQGGYAYFLGENVSIKPAVRYNIGLEDGQKGQFQGLIGFALYF
ncbi:hypothetical protein SAMN04489761_0657 [Tenacibaculum sp. MAR_2009_124]|uniref:hypothetical protein n=1 Tax=Tenacibaculum sp. MAR_2009_124 TaxID=1250059 RepID=UPI000896382A|nr:hypothetical protein [Tenacibaculum sp. MAR_2009_124]SEB42891.1 hypothetical protein SAMN04489761_0657 [Tenacibaculum sp. MAR_2009_124]